MNCRTSGRRTLGNSAFMQCEPCGGCAAVRRWLPPSGNSPACSRSVSYNMRDSVERGRFIHLDGPSGRTRHLKLEDSLLPKTEQVRISGIGGSEFPEPTFSSLPFLLTPRTHAIGADHCRSAAPHSRVASNADLIFLDAS